MEMCSPSRRRKRLPPIWTLLSAPKHVEKATSYGKSENQWKCRNGAPYNLFDWNSRGFFLRGFICKACLHSSFFLKNKDEQCIGKHYVIILFLTSLWGTAVWCCWATLLHVPLVWKVNSLKCKNVAWHVCPPEQRFTWIWIKDWGRVSICCHELRPISARLAFPHPSGVSHYWCGPQGG